MTHSSIYCLIALLATAAAQIGWLPAEWVVVFFFALAVAAVGLPHGGLDLQLGRSLVAKLFGTSTKLWQTTLFVALYLGLAGVVIGGWYMAPLLTVVSFFVLSAWHFGVEEEEDVSNSSSQVRTGFLDQFGIAVRGGLVIWIPCLFNSESVIQTLATVMPAHSEHASAIVSLIANLSPLFLFGLGYDLYRQFVSLPRRTFLASFSRTICSIVLFATCPVLVSFAIYFCGWHSIRGLVHMTKNRASHTPAAQREILTLTLASVGILAIGGLLIAPSLSLSSATIRSIFVGLSALAIPHLALHTTWEVWLNHTETDHELPQPAAGRHPHVT